MKLPKPLERNSEFHIRRHRIRSYVRRRWNYVRPGRTLVTTKQVYTTFDPFLKNILKNHLGIQCNSLFNIVAIVKKKYTWTYIYIYICMHRRGIYRYYYWLMFLYTQKYAKKYAKKKIYKKSTFGRESQQQRHTHHQTARALDASER